MKKLSVLMLIGALAVGTLAMTGCGGPDNTATDTAADTTTQLLILIPAKQSASFHEKMVLVQEVLSSNCLV
ncbi:MAG: hypothetical protein BHW44_09620 [Roseburia sp. 40_7]|nr:MAG: hypothetical protein BHW44_09620 [Roseburia sp. 40_7]